MRQSVRRGYAAEAIGGLEYSLRRGCVANTAQYRCNRGGRPRPGRSVLRQPKLARRGGPWPLQIEMEYSLPSASGHPGQRWGEVKGRRFFCRLLTFPHRTAGNCMQPFTDL